MPDRSLSSAVIWISADSEGRHGYAYVGAIRRAARVIAELEAKSKDAEVPVPTLNTDLPE